jgi:hypothetical protein
VITSLRDTIKQPSGIIDKLRVIVKDQNSALSKDVKSLQAQLKGGTATTMTGRS